MLSVNEFDFLIFSILLRSDWSENLFFLICNDIEFEFLILLISGLSASINSFFGVKILDNSDLKLLK